MEINSPNLGLSQPTIRPPPKKTSSDLGLQPISRPSMIQRTIRPPPAPRKKKPRSTLPLPTPTESLDETTVPLTAANTDIVTPEAEVLDDKVITENPELGESVVDTVDSVMNKLNASGYQGLNPITSSPSEQSLKNAELAINVTSLAFAIGLGASGFGIPFIPVVFAMGLGLKSLLNHVNSQEDVLLIYNILHMYFILTTYPTIKSVLQRIDCKSQKKDDCPKVTFVKSNFNDPRADEKVLEFIEDGLAKYIELVTLLVKKSDVQVSEKILNCHNICTGLFTTITKYLELNNEEPNMDMISANILFTPSNASEATSAVNVINQNVQKKIAITGKVLMDRGYAIFSSITRATGVGLMGGKNYVSKKNKLKKKKSKKYKRN
jgi:hypothetical protein